ncbi:MAG: RIP metalloprotease RseP [Candidatus Aminicenantia bacterium]
MIPIIERILWFLILIGIMVFVHEFGHFIFAIISKVRVEVFSFGFGPRILGIRRKETDYRISLIPLGGYVKLAGESYEEGYKGEPYEFLSQPRWKRFIILFMGSGMNIILAILIVYFINLVGVSVPAYLENPSLIGWVEEETPAYEAGLMLGDEIVEIEGRTVKKAQEVENIISTNPNKELKIKIKRKGEIIEKILKTKSRTKFGIGDAGIYFLIPPKIGFVSSGLPASKAGLKPMDEILEVNSKKVRSYFEVRDLIRKSPGKEVSLLIKRGNEIKEVKVVPKNEKGIGVIGITFHIDTIKKKYGVFKAFWQSVKENLRLTFLVVDVLRKMVRGEISVRSLSGPVDIADFSYQAAKSGSLGFLSFLAIISLQLGIINLLPIPGLDGGHIFIILIESVARRDLNLKLKERIIQIGFLFLILLMVFVVANDIVKRLPSGWRSIIP